MKRPISIRERFASEKPEQREMRLQDARKFMPFSSDEKIDAFHKRMHMVLTNPDQQTKEERRQYLLQRSLPFEERREIERRKMHRGKPDGN